MAKRTITVKVTKDLTDVQYTDLAHALWSVAQVVAGSSVCVVSDGKTTKAVMNARWEKLGRDVPWA